MPNPFANIGKEVVAELGGDSVVLRRWGAGAYDTTGRYTEGGSYDRSIIASVQPVMPKTSDKQAEGERTTEEVQIFTTVQMQASDVDAGVKGDHVLWLGRTYEIYALTDWNPQARYYGAKARRLRA